MKKILSLLLGVTMLASLCACGTDKDSDTTTAAETTAAQQEETTAAEIGAKPDNYPTTNINMIVPANAGSLIDTLARDIANRLDLGKQILITNRGGGGQSIGTQELIISKADGYNIGLISSSGLLTSPIQLGLNYSIDDMRYIGICQGAQTNMVVTSKSSGYKTWDDVVAAAKAGKEIVYTTGNVGSSSHLAMLDLMEKSGIDLKFVPFNGSAEADAALQGGHVDLCMVIREPNMKKVEEGTYVPLVMYTDKPVEGYESVPLSGDYGVEGSLYDTVTVLCAPKDTPDNIFNYIKAQADKVFVDADYIAGREKAGNTAPTIMSEQEVYDSLNKQYEKYKELYEKYNLGTK